MAKIKLTWETVIFILLVLLIFYLQFKYGLDHEVGPESVIKLLT